jgi:hypothetical protein
MLIHSWKNNDRVVSERLIADLKAVGERTRTNLRLHLGRTINRLWSKESAEAFRNPVLSALVELLTSHILNAGRPRKPKGFSDLVGNWRWDDYFYASRDAYTREQKGIWVMLDLVRKRAEKA